MAIGPIRFLTVVPSAIIFIPLASFDERNIAVGPSAPPIIPIAPASGGEKPRTSAPRKVKNIPT